ncbi:hypothetical protein DW712_00080 [Bacteroides intestinalis]|uniref:Uncharacterized protein n=1 Tax=Bacteroides intestinalis TaxID=329854 RepID=A0A414LKL0_9BACE|nr:hypothetical protein DW712_00080 [Bacteroides intestinalis]
MKFSILVLFVKQIIRYLILKTEIPNEFDVWYSFSLMTNKEPSEIASDIPTLNIVVTAAKSVFLQSNTIHIN